MDVEDLAALLPKLENNREKCRFDTLRVLTHNGPPRRRPCLWRADFHQHFVFS